MFSSIGIRSRTTQFSGAQLAVDPFPVEGDSAVDAVDVRETAAVAETDVPDNVTFVLTTSRSIDST